ncbi:homeobox protein Hox-D9-like isoform X2 [Ahaetulla prasina]|nr:homeobox protein Hox-D9-like isoform X2 [Ahaetulla prasina]
MRAWRQLCARAAIPRWTAPPCRDPRDRKERAGVGRAGMVFYHAASTEKGALGSEASSLSRLWQSSGQQPSGSWSGADNPPPAAAGSACLAPQFPLLRCLKPSKRKARGTPAFGRKWGSPSRGGFGEGADPGAGAGGAGPPEPGGKQGGDRNTYRPGTAGEAR